MIEFETASADGGATIVSPVGRLDMVAASQLRALVSETVEGGSTRLVIDLGGTQFLDSSGLGALIAALKTTRQAGGDLRIARPPEQVLMVLELTQMNTVLRPYPTVQAALDAG
jgi:anti-sigma B factor antagonist